MNRLEIEAAQKEIEQQIDNAMGSVLTPAVVSGLIKTIASMQDVIMLQRHLIEHIRTTMPVTTPEYETKPTMSSEVYHVH